MHRLFTGLAVPDPLVERLGTLRTSLPGARWRRDDQLHVTVHFFGEVHVEVAQEIDDRLLRLGGGSVEIALQGVGWFGRRAPRSIHARLAPSAALHQLASACRDIARRLNVPVRPEPFLPHITLAYCHDTPLEAVQRWSEGFLALRSEPFLIETFQLYESFRGGSRSRYQVQGDYRLNQP